MEDLSLAIPELTILEDRDLDLSLNISNKKMKKNKDSSSSKGKQHLKPKVYVCDFCMKKFPTCQALGGNGHKMERAMMKRRNNYQPLSSNNIINILSMSNRYEPSRNMIERFQAYNCYVRVPSKAPEEEKTLENDNHSDSVGVDLNLKLWFQ